jgi:hypothetical protein
MQRQRVQDLTKQLALATARAELAEREAYALATFIKDRVGAAVWDHRDVMQMLQDTVVGVSSGILARARMAERKGLPASYVLIQELVVSRFDEARVNLLDRIGHKGERGGIASPDLVTDRMKEDLRNVVRLPNAA